MIKIRKLKHNSIFNNSNKIFSLNPCSYYIIFFLFYSIKLNSTRQITHKNHELNIEM